MVKHTSPALFELKCKDQILSGSGRKEEVGSWKPGRKGFKKWPMAEELPTLYLEPVLRAQERERAVLFGSGFMVGFSSCLAPELEKQSGCRDQVRCCGRASYRCAQLWPPQKFLFVTGSMIAKLRAFTAAFDLIFLL